MATLAYLCILLTCAGIYMLIVILGQRHQLRVMNEQLEQIAADLGAANQENPRG